MLLQQPVAANFAPNLQIRTVESKVPRLLRVAMRPYLESCKVLQIHLP